MFVKQLVLFAPLLGLAWSIYPYFDTQDFIYNVPKVYRTSITLDKLLESYEKKPSKDPEWYIALGMARGQLEYTINELDKSVPAKLKENLTNLTRRMDRIRNATDMTSLVYRSKDYEYGSCNNGYLEEIAFINKAFLFTITVVNCVFVKSWCTTKSI